MTTPLSKIIKQLEKNHEQDIKNSARTMAVAAEMLERQEVMIETLADLTEENSLSSRPQKALSSSDKITKEYCIKKFGNYQKTYQFYKQNHGITCSKGWENLLPLIQNLSPLEDSKSIEERLTRLEKLVAKIIEHIDLKV